MGLAAGAALKRYILARFPSVMVDKIPEDVRWVFDLDACWRPWVCTSESIAGIRGIAASYLQHINARRPSEVVLACESAGVPLRKRPEQQRRMRGGLDPRSRAEFERQWAAGDAGGDEYPNVATVCGKEMTRKQISCSLLSDPDVRGMLRRHFLEAMQQLHRELGLAWPLVVHGDTVRRQAVGGGVTETRVEGYNPGEGESKFGLYLDGTPTAAVTSDRDALVIMLCGLPDKPPAKTFFLVFDEWRIDVGALRAKFATRGALDAWLLVWVMGGTDYVANPPQIGATSIERAAERYFDVLRGAIRYHGPVALLDVDRVIQFWYLLRRVPWLVSDQKNDDPRGAAVAAILGGGGDPERRMADALELVGMDAYEKFRAEHAALASDLAWNVRYFWGAGRVPPE